MNKWISPSFHGRSFRARVGGCLPDLGVGRSQVLWGSVLGPLLLLMCANDLSDELDCPCLLFAVDLIVLRAANGEAIQGDQDKAYQLLVRWDLPLNLSKYQRLMGREANIAHHKGYHGVRSLRGEDSKQKIPGHY